VKVSRWMLVAGATAIVAAVALAGSFGASKAPAAAAQYKVALVSDVAGFNDNGFNHNQLVGLNKATAQIHGKAIPLVSNGSSDYSQNYNTAINDGANLIIAAGFLLGDTMNQYSQNFPGTKFAITDDSAKFVGNRANEMGITYKTEQGGCMVGVLAAKEAQNMGHKVIGVVGGIEIPPVDSYIAGYKYCAQKAVPGTQVLIQYSNSFTDESACAAVAQNEMGQNAQVIFQVAGSCGDGALKYASNHGGWGIGVDADESSVASRILTSALKKTDVGVETVILKAYNHKWNGAHNVSLTLTNNGVGVGKIDASVPKAWISLMNQYKNQMINGSLKPPAHCPNNKCGS
jgi:basic membrane protein A and related proteins